jgi:ankyrin repeat protein
MYISNNNQLFTFFYLIAAGMGRNTIVALLILGGADLEAKNDDGETALMLGKIFVITKIFFLCYNI